MAVLLHNLSARAPRLADVAAVTRLLVACDIVEDGLSDYTEEETRTEWQKPGFNLENDAWVIVTLKGQFVGYASIWLDELDADGQIHMTIRVHPEYTNRGIGTLLLRLAEHRARSLVKNASPEVRVALAVSVNNANNVAGMLLEREGYSLVRHSCRLLVDSDESFNGFYQRGSTKLDLAVDAQALIGVTQLHKRTGIYFMRQYDVYEKELRAGIGQLAIEDCLQPA